MAAVVSVNPSQAQLHFQRLSPLCLTFTTSDGETLPILVELTPEQQARLQELVHGRNGLNREQHPDFAFNVTKLLSKRADGTIDHDYDNSHEAVIGLRALFQEIYGAQHISWGNYPRGHRTHTSASPSFQHTSERLKKLQFTDTQVMAALGSKNTPAEKIAYLKRNKAARELIRTSRKLTEQAITDAEKQPMTSRGQKLRKAKEFLDEPSLEAILAFEAAHQAEAVATKQAAATQWITVDTPAPKVTWSDTGRALKNLEWKWSAPPVHSTEEMHFAQDLARLGCTTRADYAAVSGAEARGDGPAVFYARLAEAVATNNTNEIRRVVEGPFFHLAFPELHQQDLQPMKDTLIGRATSLARKIDAAGNDNSLTTAGLSDGALKSTFNTAFVKQLT